MCVSDGENDVAESKGMSCEGASTCRINVDGSANAIAKIAGKGKGKDDAYWAWRV